MTGVMTAQPSAKALTGEICTSRTETIPAHLLPRLPKVVSTSVVTPSVSEKSLTDVYSREEILRLWHHQSNGNGDGRYVLCIATGKYFFRERHEMEASSPAYASLPFSTKRLRNRMREAHRSALGKSKPTEAKAIAHYPKGLDGKTTWIACDFDAHQGEWTRAEGFLDAALASSFNLERAFGIPSDSVFRVAEHTGRGFRLTILFKEPVDRATAISYQRFISLEVGCPIEDGIAEFFPCPISTETEYGKACRVAGGFNSKHGLRSLVRYEDIGPLVRWLEEKHSVDGVSHLPEDKRDIVPLEKDKDFGVWLKDGAKGGESLENARAKVEEMKNNLLKKHPINPSKRYWAMKKLVGSAFEMMGEEQALGLAKRHYEQGQTETSWKDHHAEIKAFIKSCERSFLRKLKPQEGEKYNLLTTEAERSCFRILRGWWNREKKRGQSRPRFAAYSMAVRLSISRQAVDQMRQRFEVAGIIKTEKTKSGYFFHWALDGEPANEVQPEAAENNQDPF
jgi:hypothetical protein